MKMVHSLNQEYIELALIEKAVSEERLEEDKFNIGKQILLARI